MTKPTLVVMAAGLGSRYGGLKQIDPIGPNGESIIDYSIYDAVKAGFGKVVFIIKEELKDIFYETIGNRIEKQIETIYVFQKLDDVPAGFVVPNDRKKPWGTAHAVMSCRNCVDAPFAVINSDDYYGTESFKVLFQYLSNEGSKNGLNQCSMVGFIVENTLSDNGHVARGICTVDTDGYLKEIHERTRIEKFEEVTKYTEDGENWVVIPKGSIVSMNAWGFTPDILKELETRFPQFLESSKDNILKAEYFLPEVVGGILAEKKASCKVLTSKDRWYGVTYQEDKPFVKRAISNLIQKGIYPEKLWGDGK